MAFYLRGALVEFLPTGLIAIPNVIVFQYNPETMTHTWTQSDPEKAGPNQILVDPLAVSGDPGESFSFTLFLDAADTIADGAPAAAIAKASGVYSRLAALEMLLFPSAATTSGLLGTVTAKIGSLFGASGGARAGGAGEHPEHGAVRLGARTDRAGAGHRADRDGTPVRQPAR